MSLQLSEISRAAYHVKLLEECSSGLCLFGAGFYGGCDGIHMYDADLIHVTVVDNDDEKMALMESLYPKYWSFDVFDVFEWVEHILELGLPKWDIVSVDPPTALIPTCLAQLDSFLSLSNKYVTLTTYNEYISKLELNYHVIDIIDRSRVGLTSVVAVAVEG